MGSFTILLIGMAVVIGGVLFLRLHAFLALVLAALTVAFLTGPDHIRKYAQGEAEQARVRRPGMTDAEMKAYEDQVYRAISAKSAVDRVTDGFGDTCAGIGILIAMAAIIGKCLIDSGAADRVVRTALKVLGEARAALSFLGSGFLLGIPVFFDTVFYLMLPLGKAMRLRTGKNYLLYVMSIGAGATMAHSLVPPTPGPLVVASVMNIDVGVMILGGCVVGSVTGLFGYLYAQWANRTWEVPLRESPDLTMEELDELANRDESELPAFWISILPIVLPVVLIGGKTILGTTLGEPTAPWQKQLLGAAAIAGDKNIALILSAAIAIVTLVAKRQTSRQELAKSLGTALAGGGIIILITAAGGAFGDVLQQTGIGPDIGQFSQEWGIPLIPLAFFVTALVRTAQGSATVAMITAAGIMAGVLATTGTEVDPLYVALAIGCGSKPIAWMNDSGFWVVCKMSGMTEAETLKYWTPMTTLMGLVGLGAVMLLAYVYPTPTL